MAIVLVQCLHRCRLVLVLLRQKCTLHIYSIKSSFGSDKEIIFAQLVGILTFDMVVCLRWTSTIVI